MVDYKIYIKGNYFIIENTSSGEVQYGHKKEVFVDKNNQKKLIYRIFNVKEWNYSNSLQLSQILKEDGTSYTQNEWETFYTENTGNFNSGAVLAPQILDALNNANSPSALNPFLTESDDRIKDITSLNYNSINSTINITFIDQDGISQTLTTSFINVGIKYNVLNYNDLLLVTPPPSLYDLAYVRQPQGTQWLPGSLGGTYYGKGLYMFDGVNWVEDDTDILQALNTLVGSSHTHSNLSILNNITEAFTTSLKSLYDSAEVSITSLLTTGQRLITTAEINKLLNTSGVNSGDQTTSSTHYVELGKNSSGFTGSGAFSQPNNAYLTSVSADLAIGTTTANPIRFVVNGGTTDAMTINSNGSIAFNGQVGTSGQVLQSNGASAPTWVTASGSPSGNNTSVQYNNGGSFAGATNVEIENGNLRLESLGTTTPTTPVASGLNLFARDIAGGLLPAYIGASGFDSALQPFLARNKIGFWCPPGNAVTAPGVLGFTAFSATGTATARNVATTNIFTRMRRLGYVSAATAGSLAGARVAVAQITLGTSISGINTGGFRKVIRFGCSDAATVAGARQFVGISSSTAAPTNVEPSTLTNVIGVGNGASDTNLKLYYGGSVAQTPIDLGANFPANTLSTDVYELALFCAPGSSTVGYQVTRLNTGHIVSGTLTGTVGTQLPAVTTLLTYSQNWRTNNATALAVGLDIFSDYIETDQ